jgi:hypothetical protein
MYGYILWLCVNNFTLWIQAHESHLMSHHLETTLYFRENNLLRGSHQDQPKINKYNPPIDEVWAQGCQQVNSLIAYITVVVHNFIYTSIIEPLKSIQLVFWEFQTFWPILDKTSGWHHSSNSVGVAISSHKFCCCASYVAYVDLKIFFNMHLWPYSYVFAVCLCLLSHNACVIPN